MAKLDKHDTALLRELVDVASDPGYVRAMLKVLITIDGSLACPDDIYSESARVLSEIVREARKDREAFVHKIED